MNRIIEMGAGYHIIGDVVDLSLNKDYATMRHEERTEKIKLPIAGGAVLLLPGYPAKQSKQIGKRMNEL